MTVLSLFDGMSCGQIALRELGIKVDRYFASEIDRHAIAQTQLNFPETVQIGNVTGVKAADLPKIDLVIGGSPCQGFSLAGKQLNFSDPRSALFFEYVRVLNEVRAVNPDILFLLENVRMKRDYQHAISDCMGLHPVMINSALVSAQNRVRLYWTNIRTRAKLDGTYTDIPQPADKGLFVRDILETEVEQKYYLSEKTIEKLLAHKENNRQKKYGFGVKVKYPDDKMNSVTVGGKYMYDIVCVALRGRFNADKGKNEQQMEARKDGKTNTLTSVQKDNLIAQCNVVSGRLRTYKDDYGFRAIKGDKACTVAARARQDGSGQNVVLIHGYLRRLTPTECARLQTIPEWYQWTCSDTQAYKMLGNGWTVDIIKHIFSFIN